MVTIRTILLSTALVCTMTAAGQSDMELTAKEVAAQMIPGWNLGNTMEAGSNTNNFTNRGGLGAETSWQKTETTQAVIDYVKSLGFRSVRIPCAWVMGHLSDASTYTIDAQWMNRVKQIVDYCINDGLYVVINQHWDGGWLENNIANTTDINKNSVILKTIWTQFVDKGIPVIIGEYGVNWRTISGTNESQDKHNASIRYFYKTFNEKCAAKGMVPMAGLGKRGKTDRHGVRPSGPSHNRCCARHPDSQRQESFPAFCIAV